MKSMLLRILPAFVLSWYHFVLAFLGAVRYSFPSRGMTVVGVTGTNGKSTTVEMLSAILAQEGVAVASASSVRFQVRGEERRNTLKMTMPGRFALQRFLKEARDKGCTHAVLEVTSEGILQHRHRFTFFDVAVFTNLSPEHIERHGSFEKYREAKVRLFKDTPGIHVVNLDDENAEFFLETAAEERYGYAFGQGRLKKGRAVKGERIREGPPLSFEVEGTAFQLDLRGAFNASNALCAATAALALGVPLSASARALAKLTGVPGRMEEVVASPVRVVVDYAFTPAALRQVYASLKGGGSLLCVLGAAGGGRDRWKRPELGRIAHEHCDRVFVTNEDPYEEDPRRIMEEVAQGAPGSTIVEDRREAIARALASAQKGDTVVITGKGSEDSIAQKGQKIPWDDREAARGEAEKLWGR